MKQSIVKWLFILLIAFGCLFLGSTFYYYSPWYSRIAYATAVIHPTKGNTAHGIVTFKQQRDGLHITAHIVGLTPGEHGFHIHEFGDCTCNDGVCAGDHFNPTHQVHGGPANSKRHIGDMGNLVANKNGIAQYELVNGLMTLNGPYSIIGRSVIVHQELDDLVSQPTGHSGARVGCGTIGIANSIKE